MSIDILFRFVVVLDVDGVRRTVGVYDATVTGANEQTDVARVVRRVQQASCAYLCTCTTYVPMYILNT
jgi:hypothetical protein